MKLQIFAWAICLGLLALSPVAKAQSDTPLTAPQRFEQAKELYHANQKQALLDLAQVWVAEQPKDAAAYFFLGAGLRDQAPEDALAALKTSEKMGFKNWRLIYELGLVYQLLRRFDESAIYFKRALEIDPDEGVYHKQLAVTYAMAEKYSLALPHFEKAFRGGDDSLHTLYSYGVTALEAKKPALSKRLLTEVVRRAPGFDGAAQTLGIIYFDAGDFLRAEQIYRSALEHLPDSAPLYGNLSNAQRRRGRVEEALQSAQKAVQLDPKFANGWVNLALAQKKAGQLDGARLSIKTAIDLETSEAYHWELLASIEHGAKDFAARDAAMDHLQRISPKSAQSLRKRRYQLD